MRAFLFRPERHSPRLCQEIRDSSSQGLAAADFPPLRMYFIYGGPRSVVAMNKDEPSWNASHS